MTNLDDLAEDDAEYHDCGKCGRPVRESERHGRELTCDAGCDACCACRTPASASLAVSARRIYEVGR